MFGPILTDKMIMEFIMDNLVYGMYVLVILSLFFIFIREILTWYWKLNRIERLLEEIERNTRPKVDLNMVDKID